MTLDYEEYLRLSERFLPTAFPKPATFNPNTLSVRVVAKTEEPILRYTTHFKEPVPVITLMSGVMIPRKGQVPLLDSHDRSTVSAILGSARNFEIADNVLECDVFFSRTPAGLSAAQKVREGHLTDFSVGCFYLDSCPVPAGEERQISDRRFSGPALVVTQWLIFELSIVAVGADPRAKARDSEADVETYSASNDPGGQKAQTERKLPLRLILGLVLVSYWMLVLFKGVLG